jgi:hypothetical protein
MYMHNILYILNSQNYFLHARVDALGRRIVFLDIASPKRLLITKNHVILKLGKTRVYMYFNILNITTYVSNQIPF